MSVDNFQLHTPNYKFRFILSLCLICSLKPFTVSSSVYMWYVLFIYFLFSGFLFLLCCVFMSLPARDDGFKESLKQYIHCYLETILLKWSKTAKLNLNFKIQGLISCACVDYPGISCRMLHLVCVKNQFVSMKYFYIKTSFFSLPAMYCATYSNSKYIDLDFV